MIPLKDFIYKQFFVAVVHNITNIEIIKKCKPVYSAIMQIFLSVKYPIYVSKSCVIFLLDIFFLFRKKNRKTI